MCIYICITFIFMYACVYMYMHIYTDVYVYIGAAVKAERILEEEGVEEGKGVGRGRRGRGRAAPVCSATGRQVPVKRLYSGAIKALLRRC